MHRLASPLEAKATQHAQVALLPCVTAVSMVGGANWSKRSIVLSTLSFLSFFFFFGFFKTGFLRVTTLAVLKLNL